MEIFARAQRISERLADGRLPRSKSTQMWAGFGKGQSCDGCGEAILPNEVEHEHDLTDGKTTRFHAACSVIWMRMVSAEQAV
jgi:hypothetical protein